MQGARAYSRRVLEQRHDKVLEALSEAHAKGNARNTAAMVAAIINYTRPTPRTPVDPGDLVDFDEDGEEGSTSSRVMDPERYRANWERHLKRTRSNGE